MIDIFEKEFINEFKSLLGFGVVAASLFLIKQIREYSLKYFKTIWKWFRNKSTFTDSIYVNRYVSDSLVELRVKLNGCRCFIEEFHNGSHFKANNPIWRISRTYEKCVEAVRYEQKYLKDILVSNIFEGIECFLKGDTKTLGITAMKCSECKNICKRNTFIFTPEKMPHIILKELFVEQGIKYTMRTPLTDANGECIGILGCDWTDEMSKIDIENDAQLEIYCKTLSEYAEKISYKLTKKRNHQYS